MERIAGNVRGIIVPEMNMGQLVCEVERAAKGKTKVISLTRVDAEPISPDQILALLKEV